MVHNGPYFTRPRSRTKRLYICVHLLNKHGPTDQTHCQWAPLSLRTMHRRAARRSFGPYPNAPPAARARRTLSISISDGLSARYRALDRRHVVFCAAERVQKTDFLDGPGHPVHLLDGDAFCLPRHQLCRPLRRGFSGRFTAPWRGNWDRC